MVRDRPACTALMVEVAPGTTEPISKVNINIGLIVFLDWKLTKIY